MEWNGMGLMDRRRYELNSLMGLRYRVLLLVLVLFNLYMPS
jgi:hypothetical protein